MWAVKTLFILVLIAAYFYTETEARPAKEDLKNKIEDKKQVIKDTIEEKKNKDKEEPSALKEEEKKETTPKKKSCKKEVKCEKPKPQKCKTHNTHQYHHPPPPPHNNMKSCHGKGGGFKKGGKGHYRKGKKGWKG